MPSPTASQDSPERSKRRSGGPSTARADRVAKRLLYRGVGVTEYWVIDLDARTFERSTPTDPGAERLTERMVWHPAGATQRLVIDVPAYFDGLVGP
jgi:hypothetical protein